jgi:hypothetical protein
VTAFRFMFRARPLEVHDGDTVRLSLDRGLDGTETPEWIRLGGPGKGSPLNVYAPELHEPGGIECRDFAQMWLDLTARGSSGRWPLLVETWKTRGDESKVTLGRYLGDVIDLDGNSLNLAVAAFVAEHGHGGGTGAP